ncbi:unnamed protein product [Orchesella dallaii]|uniref:Uncharacterized protein n=1 Tax=Orchesella dallaii TaxID=48710 RepID=A0ABP1QWA2_9HEXA
MVSSFPCSLSKCPVPVSVSPMRREPIVECHPVKCYVQIPRQGRRSRGRGSKDKRRIISTPNTKRTRYDIEKEMEAAFNVPLFDGRFDRYCPACSKLTPKAALWKHVGKKCKSCLTPIEDRYDAESLYSRCVERDARVKCRLQ